VVGFCNFGDESSSLKSQGISNIFLKKASTIVLWLFLLLCTLEVHTSG
jgi:hypothetical protein